MPEYYITTSIVVERKKKIYPFTLLNDQQYIKMMMTKTTHIFMEKNIDIMAWLFYMSSPVDY